MRNIRFVLILVAVGALSVATVAQQRLVVDVNLTNLDAFVEDRAGQAVLNLTPDDFQIVENGEEKTISHFSMEREPVALGIVVDRSISIKPIQKRIDEAVGFLLEESEPTDQAFVFTFAGNIDLTVEPTTDRLSTLKTMGKVKLGYGTHFYDAVNDALQYISKSRLNRKVLVVLSDGADHGSSHSLKDTIDLARRNGQSVNVIGFVGEDPLTWTENGRRQIHNEFQLLASSTEGRTFFPHSSAESFRIAKRIMQTSRFAYKLGFYSSGSFTEPSTIEVKLRGRPSAQVYFRPGAIPVNGER